MADGDKTQKVVSTGTAAEGAGPAVATPGKGTQVDLSGLATVQGNEIFSGPDKTIVAQTPTPAAADKGAALKPDAVDDAGYESSLGVKAAIDSGKMVPVAGVNGETFTATGCAGKPDGKVAFKFDRAFVGDYEYPAAARTVRGAHVIISATLAGCGDFADVRIIQVLRNVEMKGGAKATADPQDATRRTRSGWGDAASKSRGWRVDGLTSTTTPFYAENSASGFHGNHGSSTKAAKLRDTPGDWATDKNMGKEFRTAAVGVKDGKSTVLAYVEWGYWIDNDGKAAMFPAKPVAHAGSSTEFDDAATRWDSIAGNTKINETH